jgi:hypothetical protein
MIGQSTWYEAAQDAGGFSVRITVGQGDCFAGCIEQHTWSYRVDGDGTVELVGEDGEDVVVEPPVGGDGPGRLTVQLTAGPTCPVEHNPPDPNCAARPVKEAEVVVYSAAGEEVARETSDSDGKIEVDLPAGAYYVVPQPVEGLMGTADEQAFSFVGGDQADLLFGYDTGIR